ncbi:hypothetical protein JHW43_005282 [Diplocarpon mali]|nr:hypothetical protein JHW43_005282 [Diplocarpon mali]
MTVPPQQRQPPGLEETSPIPIPKRRRRLTSTRSFVSPPPWLPARHRRGPLSMQSGDLAERRWESPETRAAASSVSRRCDCSGGGQVGERWAMRRHDGPRRRSAAEARVTCAGLVGETSGPDDGDGRSTLPSPRPLLSRPVLPAVFRPAPSRSARARARAEFSSIITSFTVHLLPFPLPPAPITAEEEERGTVGHPLVFLSLFSAYLITLEYLSFPYPKPRRSGARLLSLRFPLRAFPLSLLSLACSALLPTPTYRTTHPASVLSCSPSCPTPIHNTHTRASADQSIAGFQPIQGPPISPPHILKSLNAKYPSPDPGHARFPRQDQRPGDGSDDVCTATP